MIFSIILPVLNNINYTKKFFESFKKTVNHIELSQIEIIVINNNSTDGTKEYLESIKNSYNIKIINNKNNLGVVASWNQGIRESKADHVIICNNDIEFMTPLWISNFKKSINPNVWWSSPKTCYTKDWGKISHNPSHYEQLAYGVSRHNYIVGCCFMIPKLAFEEIGYFDEQFEMKYYEDLDFINRIFQAKKRVKMIQDIIVYHAVGATSRATQGGGQNELRYQEKWGEYPQFDILKKQPSRNIKSIKHFNK